MYILNKKEGQEAMSVTPLKFLKQPIKQMRETLLVNNFSEHFIAGHNNEKISSDHLMIFSRINDTRDSIGFAFDYIDRLQEEWTVTPSYKPETSLTAYDNKFASSERKNELENIKSEDNAKIIYGRTLTYLEFKEQLNRFNKEIVGQNEFQVIQTFKGLFLSEHQDVQELTSTSFNSIKSKMAEQFDSLAAVESEYKESDEVVKSTETLINNEINNSDLAQEEKELVARLAVVRDELSKAKAKLEKEQRLAQKVKTLQDSRFNLRQARNRVIAKFKSLQTNLPNRVRKALDKMLLEYMGD